MATWLLQGNRSSEEVAHKTHPWWMVMCLTGVDYFSSLGYAPGIAVAAAGAVSPIATLVLVLLTIFGALPVYRRVAMESPHGQGSIAMLERLLPFWRGKFFVLALLGFALTDFVITITLSGADAAAHIVENPVVSRALGHNAMLLTLTLVALLGALFLRGFSEAISIAVALVVVYLVLNAVVIVVALGHVVSTPHVIGNWTSMMGTEHGNPWMLIAFALIVFPKLALGMSGFETGVAVMPLVRGDATDTEANAVGRIRSAKRLLAAAATIMSVYLVGSSVVCTWLIPEKEFGAGGHANGRALAYLAHTYLGSGFGTVYDLSTVAILWFAGASAMAGMLNLIPRYLPRYGMAPEWTSAVRPLVLVIIAVCFFITWIFDANVDAQGGAYATGVLVLITSAAVAVSLAARRAGQKRWLVAFAAMAVVFAYTTASNMVERPDGLKIGSLFIVAIVILSILSRLWRAFELRITDVQFDEAAQRYLRDAARREITLIANDPEVGDAREYRAKLHQITQENNIANTGDVIFIEVRVGDPSDFEARLEVHGCVKHDAYRALELTAPSIPNALAATLLAIQNLTGVRPNVYFEWTEGNPAANFLRFLLFGHGEVAPVTREVLRRAQPDRARRPHVHVG